MSEDRPDYSRVNCSSCRRNLNIREHGNRIFLPALKTEGPERRWQVDYSRGMPVIAVLCPECHTVTILGAEFYDLLRDD